MFDWQSEIILFIYVVHIVGAQCFGALPNGLLAAPPAPLGAVGAPPCAPSPLRAGGLFCCFFSVFSLLGVTMGWGPFWQCRRFGSSHSLASCRPRSSRFFLATGLKRNYSANRRRRQEPTLNRKLSVVAERIVPDPQPERSQER